MEDDKKNNQIFQQIKEVVSPTQAIDSIEDMECSN